MANYPAYYPQPNVPVYGQMPMYQPPFMGQAMGPQNPPQPMQTPSGQNGVPAPIQNGFSCRPVTSKEEAVAFQIPFDGSTTYFVNTANGEIYAKAYNFSNGSAPIETYVKKAPAEQTVQTAPTIPDYSPMFNELGKRLDYVAGQVNEIMGRLEPPKPVQQPQRQAQGNKGKGNER